MRSHVNGACPECGSTDHLTLAQDMTQYSEVRLDGGVLRASRVCVERMGAIDDQHSPVRLFCVCGEYLDVPEELME